MYFLLMAILAVVPLFSDGIDDIEKFVENEIREMFDENDKLRDAYSHKQDERFYYRVGYIDGCSRIRDYIREIKKNRK